MLQKSNFQEQLYELIMKLQYNTGDFYLLARGFKLLDADEQK